MGKYKELEIFLYQDSTGNSYKKKYDERYNSDSTYRFDFEIKDNPAFVVISVQLSKILEELHKLDKKILNELKEFPKEAIADYEISCLIDEIKITNEIEGIHSTRKEIVDILKESEKRKNKDNRFFGLVKKYYMLVTDDGNSIQLDVSQDVRNLYDEIVLAEVIINDPKDKPDGVIFRKGTVSVVDACKVMHHGVSPESELIKSMDKALKIFKDDNYLSLIRTAVFHYMFCYMHPFYNGNGRTARFISSFSLRRDLNDLVSFRLSHAIKKNKSKYYKLFNKSNNPKNKGDLTPFCIGFLEIVKESMLDLYKSIIEKKDKYNYYSDHLKKLYNLDNKSEFIDFKILNELVLDSLFGFYVDTNIKGITINEINKKLNISRSTINRRLNKYINEGLVEKIKYKNFYLYYINLDMIDINVGDIIDIANIDV